MNTTQTDSHGSATGRACPKCLAVILPGLLLCAQGALAVAAPPPWRMIYNNDLDNIRAVLSPWQSRENPDELSEGKIRASVAEAAVPGMGAQLISPGFGWVPLWRSKIVPLAAHEEWFFQKYGVKPDHPELTFFRNGGDIIGIFIDECHKRGNAALVSFRVNDGHNLDLPFSSKDKITGRHARYSSRFYAEHPEYRRDSPPRENWQHRVHNWAIGKARAHKLALLLEIIASYPGLDGVEVDFLRHPYYFPPGMHMDERVEIMTGFLSKIRAVLDATSTATDRRPRYLGVRVPLAQKAPDNTWRNGSWNAIGFDPAAWAAAGVDFFNFSPHYEMNQDLETIALARKKAPGTRIFVELTHTPWVWRTSPAAPAGFSEFTAWRRSTREILQTTARSAYARGADGVSFFNFCYYRERWHTAMRGSPYNEPPFEILPTLADRAALENAPCYFFKRVDHARNFFAKPGDSASLTLDIAPARGNPAATLRLLLLSDDELFTPENDPGPDIVRGAWRVTLNGINLQPAVPLKDAYPFPTPYKAGFFKPGHYLTFAIPAGALKDGANTFRVRALDAPRHFRFQWLEIIQRQ